MNMPYLQATDPSDLSKQEGPYLVKCSQLLSDDEQTVNAYPLTDDSKSPKISAVFPEAPKDS